MATDDKRFSGRMRKLNSSLFDTTKTVHTPVLINTHVYSSQACGCFVFVSAACQASDGSSMQVAAGKVTTESSTEALNFCSIDAFQA